MTELVLQPDATAGIDTWIMENYDTYNSGIHVEFRVGVYTALGSSMRGLLKFDISSIPVGVTITSAVISLYSIAVAAVSRSISAHKGLTQWYEGNKNFATLAAGVDGSTWALRNNNGSVAWGAAGGQSGMDYAATPTATTAVSAINTWYTWDVTADVQSWYAGTTTNYGHFFIGDEANAYSRCYFCSSDYTVNTTLRPKLTVTYTSAAALTAADFTLSAVTFDAPTLGIDFGTPLCRTFTIDSECRSTTIPAEDRTFSVDAELRRVLIDCSGSGVTSSNLDFVFLTASDLTLTAPTFDAPTIAEVNGITLSTPVDYTTYQRNGSNQANIAITGTYYGTPTTIEASFNGGAYAVIDASPSGGTFSGTLSTQSAGQGTLTVRFSNATSVTDTSAYIGIGDIFIIGGQSNACGRGNSNKSYSHATLKATMFGNDYNWKELSDPVDAVTNQVDSVSDDGSALGSVWPLIATSVLTNNSLPVAFVPCAKGGTAITSWLPGANHQDRSTLYGSMIYRALQTGCKAVLWWQGESDVVSGMAEATYNGHLDTIANAIGSDLSVKIIPCKLQNMPDLDETNVNNAIGTAWGDNSNVLTGPDLSSLSSDDAYHIKTNENLASAASLWWTAIKAALSW